MKVQILLSTYNGALYLRPLVESLLAQDYPGVEVLVRDDGSSDRTVTLLQAYAAACPNIKVAFGKNLGFVRSFFKLIELSSSAADYLALCDQDDVWQPDKVSRAVEFLSRYPQEIPALYCSRLAVVDENLKSLGYSDLPRRGLSFHNALVECPVGLGCTILLNQAARRLLLREFPQHVYSHDWWIYLVISGFGTVIYDEESRILYRQHASNVFGVASGVMDSWRIKIRRFLKSGKLQLVVKQVEEFRRIYGSSLSDNHKNVLDRFLKSGERLGNRLRYALACDVYRQSMFDNLTLKMLIALNRL